MKMRTKTELRFWRTCRWALARPRKTGPKAGRWSLHVAPQKVRWFSIVKFVGFLRSLATKLLSESKGLEDSWGFPVVPPFSNLLRKVSTHILWLYPKTGTFTKNHATWPNISGQMGLKCWSGPPPPRCERSRSPLALAAWQSTASLSRKIGGYIPIFGHPFLVSQQRQAGAIGESASFFGWGVIEYPQKAGVPWSGGGSVHVWKGKWWLRWDGEKRMHPGGNSEARNRIHDLRRNESGRWVLHGFG